MSYDRRTALAVVDVQNDFADPAGSLYVHGGEEVVRVVNEEVARARAAGALVVYTQDWHPPETPHFASSGGAWPDHCVQGTWGARLHPDLVLEGQVVRKGTDGQDGYSGFAVRDPESGREDDTELQRILHEEDIERVVVVGLATDYCVRATALDAVRRGFVAAVVTAGVRAVDLSPGDGQAALAELADAGVTLV